MGTSKKRLAERQALMKHYEVMCRYANDVILLADGNFQIIECNERAMEVYGYRRDELLGMDIKILRSPESRAEFVKNLNRLVEEDGPIYEVEHCRKDGSTFPVEVSARPVEVNGIRYYQGVVRDITARKTAAESLRRSEEFLRLITDNMSDMIRLTDLDGTIRFASPSHRTFLGYNPGERLGKSVMDPVHPDDRERVQRAFMEALARNAPGKAEYRVMHADGHPVWLETIGNFIHDENGVIKGAVFSSRDITERKSADEKLHESENRHKELFEHMNSGVAVYDAVGDGEDFVFRDFNKAAERSERIDKKDVLGKSVRDVFPGIEEFGLFEVFQRVWRTSKAEHHPVSFYRDGRVSGWKENYVYKLPSGELVSIFDDVSKRMETEEELKATSALLKTAIRSSPPAIVVVDNDDTVRVWNPAAETILGWSAREVIGRLLPIVPEDQSGEYHEIRKSVEQGNVLMPTRTRRIRKDGTPVDISLSVAPLVDSGGKLIGRMGIFTDITEHLHAEKRLKAAEEKYRSIVENAQEGIFQTTPEGRFLMVNKAFADMLGYDTPEELVAAITDIRSQVYVDPENRDGLKKASDLEGVVRGFVTRFYRKDGSFIWVSINRRNVSGEDGRLLYYEGLCQDITSRKEAEENLIFTIRKLQETKDMLLQSEKLAAVGLLSAGVAHEILNPVNIVSMRIQLLEMTENLSDKAKDALQICNAQIERIVKITKGLNQFSRISAGSPSRENVNPIIENVMTLTAPRMKVENVAADVHLQQGLPEVLIDRSAVEQVVMNLINNAIDAMSGKQDGMLQVATALAESEGQKVVRVSFSDNGTGIREEDLVRIFDPFFTTKGPDKGTGLGLSICYGIVRDHGGRIRAGNNERGGATFIVDLPLPQNHSKPASNPL